MTTPIASLRQCMKITFPPVMLQLLEEAVKPSPDFEVIARTLGMDPVLTATVLTLANSPYYGSAQKVTDLKRAATILGTREILKIALSITYQKHLNDAFKKRGIDFFANWRITIWSAIAAELLAEKLCPEMADQAYLTALLKDISLLLLICSDSESFKGVSHGPVITAYVPGQLEEERDLWRADHCQLTSELLDDLSIPVPNPACIANHHDFDAVDSYDPLTQAIILFQDTSLVYVSALADFFGAAYKVGDRDGRLVELLLFAGAVYFVICFSASQIVKRLQKKYHPA